MSTPSVVLDPRRPRRRRWPALFTALLVSGTAACGGGGGDTPTPPTPTPGTLAVALANFPASVVAGSQAAAGVTVTRGGSFTGAVALAADGMPSGVTASFSATSLAAGVTTATLTLQVGSSVAAGSYPITVRATGTGVSAATALLTLSVTAAATPSFSLSAAPSAVSVVAGQQGTSSLTIARSGGFTGAVQLIAEGAPSGVTPSFAVSPVTGTSSVLTLAVGAATAPGAYPITVRGTSTGVAEQTATVTLTVSAPAPTPTLTVASAASTVTVAQGQSSVGIAISLTRGGGLTGNATMALEGAPTGVTGVFTPNPATATTSSLMLSVGAAVAPGSYPLTVRGTVGTTSGTAAISLTVTAAAAGTFSLALAPTAATVTAGGTTSPVLAITRSGGFTGTVNLTATGAPAGVSVHFTPAAATGAQATMTVSTTAGVAPGAYTITVRGNATGIAEQSASLTLTVQGSGGGSGTVTWRFCDLPRAPTWFAFQDGVTELWTRVLPGTNETYTFTMNNARGGVAYAQPDDEGDQQVLLFLSTRTELQALGLAECETNPARRLVNGTVLGLTPGQSANIAIGGDLATVSFPGTGFTSTTGRQGVVDMLAARATLDLTTFSSVVDRLILRRDLNPANNGTLTALDFESGESFAPVIAQYAFNNAGGGLVMVSTGFVTGRGDVGVFSTGFLNASTSREVRGVPAARTQPGDLHQVVATSAATNEGRTIIQYNREVVNRTFTFAPPITAPTVSVAATSPYPRLQAQGTWQPEYSLGLVVSFTQTSARRTWSVSATREYFGAAASYAIVLPDFSGVAGFNAGWALAAGASTQWGVLGTGVVGAPVGPAVENFRLNTAGRIGTITP